MKGSEKICKVKAAFKSRGQYKKTTHEKTLISIIYNLFNPFQNGAPPRQHAICNKDQDLQE
jgi:hypothetical protein